jgi:very-short-patch-repair endonuclease
LRNKLVVELDGKIHEENKIKDHYRDQWLKRQGYTVLRFKNEELEEDKARVLKIILNTLIGEQKVERAIHTQP